MAKDAEQLRHLHTTDAYKRAVLNLMVAEANWAAEQLQLPARVPNVTGADMSNSCVNSPPMGIGGSVSSAHYSFDFWRGKLRSIDPLNRPRSLMMMSDAMPLPEQVTVLDAGEASALAKRWLCALSVDVHQMEKAGPPNVFAVPRHHIPAALILVGWGSRLPDRLAALGRPSSGRPLRPGSNDSLFVELLGTTGALISLRINDPSLLKRVPLELPNASELLGPTPPRRHFVEQVLGGLDAYETVAAPERVQAWLLTSAFDGPRRENVDRAGPVDVVGANAAALSETLINFDSYYWGNNQTGCMVDFGARLQFTRGSKVVRMRLCFECDYLEVGGLMRGKEFFPSHNAFVKALQAVFPNDKVVQGLPLRPNRA